MKNLVLGAAVAIVISSAMTVAGAAVYAPQQQLPAAILDGFKAQPSALLSQYPIGGAQMISRVRDLVASDPATLPMVVNLLKGPLGTGQQSAIVTGLAQAARLAFASDPAFYNEIQTAVAGSGNADAVTQFAALTGNAPGGTGAGAGGGAGGGGTGGGGPTGSGVAFGGANSSNNTTVARNSTTQLTPTATGSVGATSNSVSPR